jgi:hypothetical protein
MRKRRVPDFFAVNNLCNDFLSRVKRTISLSYHCTDLPRQMCRILLYVWLSCYITTAYAAERTSLLCLNNQPSLSLSNPIPQKDLYRNKSGFSYPPRTKDFTKLTLNTCVFIGSSFLVFGALTLCPEEVSGWKKEDIQFTRMVDKWSENVKSGPVIDKDNFFFNNITHPYCGAIYYMTARSSGFRGYESFLYSAVMSTLFWEYGLEAFAEVPSSQDIFITPVVGSIVGEVFFNVKKIIVRHDKRVLGSRLLGTATLLLIDPFNTILDAAGYRQATSGKRKAASGSSERE